MRVVSVQKYKGNTFIVEFDNEKNAYLNRDIIFQYRIGEDMELSDELFEEILFASDLRRARERALYLLEVRDHSMKELYVKLRRNYPDEVCRKICAEMKKAGLIDDRRYAERLAEEFINIKRWGKYRAVFEMQRRGISKELAEELVESYEDDSIERLKELVETKYARYLVDGKGFLKVKNALARQGYAYGDINEVLAEYKDFDKED